MRGLPNASARDKIDLHNFVCRFLIQADDKARSTTLSAPMNAHDLCGDDDL
jgi:hypothetical protein